MQVEHTEKHKEHTRTGKRPRKLSSQAEQQHNVNSAGILLLKAEKSEGLIIAVLASAVWKNDAHRNIKELPFDCKAFFFFFCVPQLYLWGSPFLGEIFAYVTVFFLSNH